MTSAGATPSERPRVVLTRRVPQAGLDILQAAGVDLWVSPHERALSDAELHDAVAGAHAVITMLYDRVDGALLDAAGPQLRCVANAVVGYDNIDVAAARQRGVLVTNTPGVLTDATADLAIAMLLAVTRRVGEGERLVRSGTPWSWDMLFLLGSGLRGKRLGIVGLGQIGAATARRARAFGMEVAYSGRRDADPAVAAELGGAQRLPLDELLATSDVVSLHCPLTEQTRHLLDAGRLALLRPTAYLINTARGPIIDEAALARALRAGALAGAALDVYEHEPRVHPDLLTLENVVLIPHLGSATVETRSAMSELAARNVLAVLDGRAPLTPVGAPTSAVVS